MIKNWNFSPLWNNALLNQPQRELKPRDYLYASELGGSKVDIYLKMLGTKPTNPPNFRSLRKFQAGYLWEWIVKLVFTQIGILKSVEVPVRTQDKGMLMVSGRLDVIAGGKPNFDEAIIKIKDLGLPETLENVTMFMINELAIQYGEKEFETYVVEVKSISAMMFEAYKKKRASFPLHCLQLFHYVRCGNMANLGKIVYVCKDDCRLLEYNINRDNEQLEKIYTDFVGDMTNYYNTKTMPPLEKFLTFDEDTFRFSKNWKVEYSNYLTMLYGFETPKAFADIYTSKANSFNRVFKRFVLGEKITDKNLEILKEMQEWMPNIIEQVKKAKESGIFEQQENDDDEQE
jgi:hypothetical protein